MSSPRYTAAISGYGSKIASWIAADGTKARLLTETITGAAESSPLPQFFGGISVIDCVATSSSGSTQDVQLYQGKVRTTQDTTATGNITITASSIVRANNSWITDGWRPGMNAMVFPADNGAENASVDGILGTITAVSATTLTVNGTPFAGITLSAGSRIVQVSQLHRQTVPANAGNSTSVASYPLLGASNDAANQRSARMLASDEVMIAAPVAAIAALPAYLNILTTYGRF